jgi:hypothetical protein
MTSPGHWEIKPQATSFPLLSQVSEIGKYSPSLTAQWQASLKLIDRLVEKNLLK